GDDRRRRTARGRAHGRGRDASRRGRRSDRRASRRAPPRGAGDRAGPADAVPAARRGPPHPRPARSRRRGHRREHPRAAGGLIGAAMDLATELDLALALADLADAVTLPRFQRQDFTLGWKDDRTEVTEADREAEATLAAQVQRARPDHGFFGEEFGHQGDRDSPWQWIVDPIDGTSGFVRGIPVWGSLIALTHRGEVVIGVVSAPALERRWSAARGMGAFAGDRRCQVS